MPFHNYRRMRECWFNYQLLGLFRMRSLYTTRSLNLLCLLVAEQRKLIKKPLVLNGVPYRNPTIFVGFRTKGFLIRLLQ